MILAEWRLIKNTPAKGAWNMAVDEAILNAVSKHLQKPTLRLYSWNPYCLSLGHAQPISDINLILLKYYGWGLVRRPTGGRAILHADELTYSICAPLEDPHVSGSILESYRKLSSALMKALQILGIHAISEPKHKHTLKLKNDPVCFEAPSDYEIMCNGKKIIGSAQARKNNSVLQHGAIPIFGDITRIINVLNFPDDDAKTNASQNLKERAGTLEYFLNKKLSWDNVAQAVLDGFQSKLKINFILQNLSDYEHQLANDFVINKYDNDKWTKRI